MFDATYYQNLFQDAFATVFQSLSAAIPAILEAVIILTVGWIIARVIRSVIQRILSGINFDEMVKKIKLDVLFQSAGIKASPSGMLAQLGFFMIMIVFLVAVSERLGWAIVSEQIAQLISLIPVVLSGIVLFVIGYFIAGVIRDVLRNATESLGIGAGSLIASLVYYFLMISITFSTLSHIGIDISIISGYFELIIKWVVIGAAGAYAFAAKDLLSNTLSNFYSRNTFEVGQRVRVGDVSGEIIEIRNISVELQTDRGRVIIPARQFTSERVEIID